MKKKDIIILAVLAALWIAWPAIDRHLVRPLFHGPAVPQPAAAPQEEVEDGAAEPGAPAPEFAETPAEAPADVPEEPPAEPSEPEVPQKEEVTAVLENDRIAVTVSSRGAILRSATLREYRQTLDPASPPVLLDFGPRPALACEGLAGFPAAADFDLRVETPGRRVVLERTAPSGLRLRRSLTLEDGYVLQVSDELANTSAEPVALKGYGVQLGLMTRLEAGPQMKGMVYLGVDSLSPGGEAVRHFGSTLPRMFQEEVKERGLAKLPATIERPPHENPVDWVAVKNKYFAQILTPEGGGEGCRLYAAREILPQETEDPSFVLKKMTPVAGVAVSVRFPERVLEAGETAVRGMTYYVGPKKYSELSRRGLHQVDVMEFGRMAPIGKLLLVVLNAIHDYLWPHNYGLAIMLLTVLIRIVFWPITHKSTESMKRMQEVQPLISEIRQKYKDNAQKQQQEIMAVYKEHKVNPLGGCLPTLIQIPVFIALFVVLRSAIELRFSPFLWIRDLSEPENLFAGVLPIPLNILPLLMAGTMYWQQKLTPSAGDAQQQKMMAFMPLMMLVLFYNFASGLVLYWTTSQCLMIAQQLTMKRKQALKAAAEAAA